MPDRVRLTVPSDPRSLTLVAAVTERYCDSLGISPRETDELVSLVRDAVEFTLAHAYPQDPTGEIELTLDHVDDSMRVDVHDWGLPLASAGGGLGELPAGLSGLAALTDDLRLVNLGTDGKRISFCRRCQCSTLGDPGLHTFDATRRTAHVNGDVRTRVELRDAVPEDSEAISQLLYENYHLSYGHPDFYRPRWVAEQLESAALLSSVAVLDSEIIGHHAVMLERGKTSAETGVAVVHPAYRGLGIFNRLLDRTLERCDVRGLDAVWGRAVTVHPYSQRSEQSHGYRDAALMLGSVPAKMTMEGVDEAAPGKRTASLLAFRVLRPSTRAVALPERYADLLRAAYANVDLTVSSAEPPRDSDGGLVRVDEDSSRATGFLTVTGWDPAGFAKALRHLLACHHDVIYADLDLHRGVATDEAVDRLSEIGFFYSGLVLYGSGGRDFLRMQRMNAENVELEHIVCDAPYAQDLLRAVLADRELTDGG